MTVERAAIAGLKWISAAKLIVQVVSWVITLLVIRLLTPEDYGLMAAVTVVTSIVSTLAEMGLSASIVQARELPHAEQRKLCGLSLTVGFIATIFVVAAAPAIAWLFQDARLTALGVVAALQFTIVAAGMMPEALASRDMSFRTLALIEIAAGITGSVTTLALAWLGYGVWSLVAGILTGAATRTAGLLWRGTRVSPDFDFRGLAHHLSFGGTLLLGRLGYLITTQADVAIASRLLPREAVGHYAVALQLATLPMQKLMGLVNQVTLPAVARLQDDLPRAREGLLKAVSLLTLGSVPVLWGISAVAPELIRVLLGDKWQQGGTADVIRIITLTIPARMIWAVLHTAAIGLGSKATDLVNTLVSVAVLPLAFFVGARYGGIVGIALGWLIGIALVLSVTLRRASRAIGIALTDIARQAAAPLLCGALMYGAVAAVRSLLGLAPGLTTLLLLAAVGAGVYIGAAFLFARRHIAIAQGFLRAARHG